MNQGRIWCVVHPTVGLPLFLGSVALTSFAVHASVMTHTPWMSSYWTGAAKGRSAMNEPQAKVASVTPDTNSAFAITIAPVAASAGNGQTSFVVTVTPNPGSTAKPETTALMVSPETKTLALAGSIDK